MKRFIRQLKKIYDHQPTAVSSQINKIIGKYLLTVIDENNVY